MNGFEMENAFGQPPAEFRQGMEHALKQVKEDKTVKKFTARTLILAAALVLMLCGIALAVSSAYGVEWFLKERYADPPKLPGDFSDQVQSDIPQTNINSFADVAIRDAAWLDETYDESRANTFQMTFRAVLQEAQKPKYEMHEAIRLNNDGDTSERNGVDWLWTETGHGPIPEMMNDPQKQLALFEPLGFTLGTPDGFAMPGAGEDSLHTQDDSLMYNLFINLNWLDPAWLENTYRPMESKDAQALLQTLLENAEEYRKAKAQYTDENGLTTMVLNYFVWEYPDWENARHNGYLTFKVKLP